MDTKSGPPAEIQKLEGREQKNYEVASDNNKKFCLEEVGMYKNSNNNSNKRVDTKKGHSIWPLRKVAVSPKYPNLQAFTSEITKEAWMCGVCAKSFSSFESAQRHEDYHIQEVISDLGWLCQCQQQQQQQQQNTIGDDNHSNKLSSIPTGNNKSLHVKAHDSIASSQDEYSTPPSTPDQHAPLSTPDKHQQHTGSLPHPHATPPALARPDMLHVATSAPNSPRANTNSQRLNTPALQRKAPSSRRKHHSSDDLDGSFNSFGTMAEFGLSAAVLPQQRRESNSHKKLYPLGQRCNSKSLSPVKESLQQQQQQQLIPHSKKGLFNDNSHPRLDSSDTLSDEHDLLVPHGMKEFVVLADEALFDVCSKAESMILTHREKEAELELALLAQDKAYYDLLDARALDRQRGGTYNQFRTEGKTMLSKVQNKFVDAYQLCKEGKKKGKNVKTVDHYNRKRKGQSDVAHSIENNRNTLFVNVIVKASLKVVRHELQRLAKERWEAAQNEQNAQTRKFQQFRELAQDNLVKLAGLALAADFTPRRIAVQLSNDVYRLLTPKLKRRGVSIETDIEYRVGPYFVLAVNVTKVDWRRLVKSAHRDVAEATRRWRKELEERDEEYADELPQGVIMSFLVLCYGLTKLTKFEVMAQLLAWCHYLHWVVYVPICHLLYHTVLGELFRRYFLATITDEIFNYVEEKGMEMDIGIHSTSTQAAFMLTALREIRADGREKKEKQHAEGDDKGAILGPLLGPAFPEDKLPAPPIPEGFQLPENLEYVGLELELPVGFRRLRWAFVSPDSKFFIEGVFKAESNYENIEVGTWSKHANVIGMGTLPDGIKESDIVGAERKLSYLMPKSVFVKANTCYETGYIDAYNDYCFVLRKKAFNPEVPYGSTFFVWTKYVIINTGGDSCKLICSVEAEFPNGPPIISRQIKGGMRTGVGELFVKTGKTINKYAEVFP